MPGRVLFEVRLRKFTGSESLARRARAALADILLWLIEPFDADGSADAKACSKS